MPGISARVDDFAISGDVRHRTVDTVNVGKLHAEAKTQSRIIRWRVMAWRETALLEGIQIVDVPNERQSSDMSGLFRRSNPQQLTAPGGIGVKKARRPDKIHNLACEGNRALDDPQAPCGGSI